MTDNITILFVTYHDGGIRNEALQRLSWSQRQWEIWSLFLCESDHRANAAVIFFLKCMAHFSVHVQPFLLVLHSHSQLLDTRLGNAPFKQWLGLALCSITGKTTTSGTHQSCPTGCTNQALCKTASVSQTLMRGQHSGSHFFFFFFTDIRKGLQRNVTSPPVTSA